MTRTLTMQRPRHAPARGAGLGPLLAAVLRARLKRDATMTKSAPLPCPCDTATLSGRLLNDAGPVAGRVWAHPTSQQARSLLAITTPRPMKTVATS